MNHDVFISYSRKDTAIADRICAAFDRAGISYFIDRQGIAGGMEFPQVLAEAIMQCRLFLFLASENSYQSKFTNNEVLFAFNEKPHNTLLPYIIDSSRLPSHLRFTFASINVRNIEEHSIETVLIDDVLNLLGRDMKKTVESKTVQKAAAHHTTEETASQVREEIDCRVKRDAELVLTEIATKDSIIDEDEQYQANGYIVVGKGVEVVTREDLYWDVCGEDEEYDFDEKLNGGKIKIANSVREIAYDSDEKQGVFEGTDIVSVIIPNSVIKIGESAFKDCIKLSSIDIPNSVKIIEDCAFENCALKSVIIPSSVVSIGSWAFYDCEIESVVIPSSVEKIGDYAFNAIINLLDTVEIPRSVKFEQDTFSKDTKIIIKE